MHHLILLTALALYAAGLFLALQSLGVGLIQTLTAGVVTVAFVWGALHLAYVSDALYTAGVVALPASVAWTSVPFAWLWRYIALNGWLVGIAFYVPIWLSAAVVRLLRQRPNNSFKPSRLRGSA